MTVGLMGILGCASSEGNVILGDFLADNADDPLTRAIGRAMVTAGRMEHEKEVAAAGADREEINIYIDGKGNLRKAPTAEFNNITLEHGVYQDGESVMIIHVDFNINDHLGYKTQLSAYFFKDNGDRLMDKDGYLRSEGGQVSAGSDVFFPNYENSHFSDKKISIPVSQFDITSPGKYYLKLRLNLWDLDGDNSRVIAKSNKINFIYTL